ncbi:MAG TPA: hypothetical protein VK116_00805 [Planctomycetota bacterium]|nr:hypothetical protein [Planctomycetota bacterium]
MTNLLDAFDRAARARINENIRAAEAKVGVEILPVVAMASGDYDRAEDLVGLWLGAVATGLAWLLFQGVDHDVGWSGEPAVALGYWTLALIFLVAFVAGVALAHRVPWLRRLFIAPRELDRATVIRAKTVFFDRRVHRTTRGTGILLYVSLFERRVAVLADDAVAETMSERALGEVRDEVLAGLRRRDLAAGLAQGIDRLARLLEGLFPSEAGRTDEVPSEVVVIE